MALLVGVSVDYCSRLERGNLVGTSDEVLDSLARALNFDKAERAHLFTLARGANTAPIAPRRPRERVQPTVQRILDATVGAPALVRNGRLDILGSNRLGCALFSDMFADPHRPANLARFVFLNP